MSSSRSLLIIAGLFQGLCGCDTDEFADVPVHDGDVHRIASQNPNAQVMASRYLVDPDVTMTSYASTGMSGCSGTLVGPNIALTAGHCGYNAHYLHLRTYRNLDHTKQQVESVLCEPLYQTYPDTDLMPMYCPPISGVNPGDKYGYVDLDPRKPEKGDDVYSVWQNPIDDIGGGLHMIYSDGEVIATDNDDWYVPDADSNTGIDTNLWGFYGASGSAQFSVDRHKLLIGPTSVAAVPEGPLRGSLSMASYLGAAEVDDPANVNDPMVTALNLDPNDYLGSTDKDGDHQLDIQTDLELLTGEGQRDHYALTFYSERKNALWTDFPGQSTAVFYPELQYVHLPSHGGASTVEALRHEHLNLKQSTRYRVSVMVHANTTISNGLEIGFDGDFGQYGWSPVDSVDIDLTKNTGWVMHTFELKSSWTGDTGLTVRKRPGADASIAAISIIEQGSTMDFDLHDKRYHWRNENNGARAFILPDGTGSGSDWAGAVSRTDSLPSGSDFPMRNRQLALLEGANYQMCFNFRKFRGHPNSPITGTVRVLSDGVIVYEQSFDGNDPNWDSLCTDNFTTISSNNMLLFGIDAPPPDNGVPSGAVYLVDDIEIDEI